MSGAANFAAPHFYVKGKQFRTQENGKADHSKFI